MASQWDWIRNFERQARREGDNERVRLVEFWHVASEVSPDSPDEKLVVYESGRELAKCLKAPWFEMFYEHNAIECILSLKKQPHLALDRAVRAVFETSKSHFADFPQRFVLQMAMSGSYMAIDAIGYEKELRALFAHTKQDSAIYPDHHAYYRQEWSEFLELVEDEGAAEVAFQCLHHAEQGNSKHYLNFAYKRVCIALMRFDRDAAREHLGQLAALGDETAGYERRTRNRAQFLMWRAVAARWNGNETEAGRFYRQAFAVQSKLAPPQDAALYAAMVFHEEGGEWERALQICQSEIRILRAHKLSFLEAQRRVDKCRLLKTMGRDFSKDAQRLRRVAAKLKSRAHWEMRLEQLESGSLN